jgi:error-prone DNA polymerase
MHKRSRKALHDVLTAIRLRKTVAQCGYDLASNAEQHLRTRLRLSNLYEPELLLQTICIAERCHFNLDELRYEYPEEVVPQGYTAAQYLHEQTWHGAAKRYPAGIPENVSTQIKHELALITELGYETYFLTVYDLVRFAVSRQILCQGRGSAANSAVCYCLGITAVNPANGNALFERFISRERNEPPDIDVDFEHQRREEVIQYLYQKYGRQRAALTGVVTSYRPRSVLRDTGRALGIDAQIIDQVAKSHRWWDGKQNLIHRLLEAGLDAEATVTLQWAELAQALMGFPRHLSQHPGGFVLARGLLSRLVPIENAAMPQRSVVQWDKDDLDAVGLLKVDVLALGMLTVIRRSLEWVAWRRKLPHFSLQDIADDDGPTYDMICAADGLGAYWNGRKCSVSTNRDLSKSVVTCSSIVRSQQRSDAFEQLSKATYLQRTWGDAFGYALVATGRVDIMLDPLKSPWDVGPMPVILREAGGLGTTWTGEEDIYGRDFVAANHHLHPQVIDILKHG